MALSLKKNPKSKYIYIERERETKKLPSMRAQHPKAPPLSCRRKELGKSGAALAKEFVDLASVTPMKGLRV